MREQDRPIFGIDLGTSYSCVAYIDAYQQPVVIANAEGETLTPSVVQFEADSRIVGKEAQESALQTPDQVVTMIKRQMGQPYWRFEYEEQQYTAEEISSYILRKLAYDAEQQTGYLVIDVVITCPAYFGITQREATANAGKIAGLNVWEVINEPTAAAIAYGLEQEQDQVVLVYDLGGGTFDVTVIELKQGMICVVATGGDHTHGGRDWNEAIVLYLAQEWGKKTKSTDDILDVPEVAQDLWQKAEIAKRILSVKQETTVTVMHAGQHVEILLSRQMFERLTTHLLEQTIAFTASTIEQAKRQGCRQIDKILLVGGSTWMPQVMEHLQEEFHLPIKRYDPDEAVAKGAAIYGHKLKLDRQIQAQLAAQKGTLPEQELEIGILPQEIETAQEAVAQRQGLDLQDVKKFHDLSITNVASHSFGILAKIKVGNEYRDIISNLVLVNDPLPYSRQCTYSILEANKEAVEIKIVEDMLAQATVDNPSMGETIGTVLLPLPPALPAGAPIEVFFELNRQGRLHVVGREPSTNVEIEATIETSAGISEVEMGQAEARQHTIFIA
jgi:molecular chaperone DnaK